MNGMFKEFLVLLCLGAVAACTPHQGVAERYDTLKENTDVIEIRLTNFEERLSLVEQEIGVLRSHGALPEGARWVDPAPSLSKVGASGVAASPASRPVPLASSVSPPPPSTIQSTPPTVSASLPQVHKAIPSQNNRHLGGTDTSAIDQFIGGGTDQGVVLGQGGVSSQRSSQGFPSLAPLQGGGATPGGRIVSPAQPPVAQVVSAQAITPSAQGKGGPSVSSGSLKGLPASFRTGVRAYDEALAMYYRHEYSRSLQAFTSFIEANKGHKLLANALYWQGESAYSQADYLGAILSFKSITSQFPKHAKAADALLKIGMSYERLKDSDNAQFYWKVLLDDFPKSSAARVARGKMPR